VRIRLRNEIKYIDCLLRCNKRVMLFPHTNGCQRAFLPDIPALELRKPWNAQ
jgi:hypothetical protein